MSEVSKLIADQVNRHGELHLNREATERLIAWLRSTEEATAGMQKLFLEFGTTLEAAGIPMPDAFKQLREMSTRPKDVAE